MFNDDQGQAARPNGLVAALGMSGSGGFCCRDARQMRPLAARVAPRLGRNRVQHLIVAEASGLTPYRESNAIRGTRKAKGESASQSRRPRGRPHRSISVRGETALLVLASAAAMARLIATRPRSLANRGAVVMVMVVLAVRTMHVCGRGGVVMMVVIVLAVGAVYMRSRCFVVAMGHGRLLGAKGWARAWRAGYTQNRPVRAVISPCKRRLRLRHPLLRRLLFRLDVPSLTRALVVVPSTA